MKEDIKKLLRESITVYENKKESEDKKSDKEESDKEFDKEFDKEESDEEGGHKDKEISKGDVQTLRKLYVNNIKKHREGGILAKCVFGSTEDRSKLRKTMRLTKKDIEDVGIPNVETYNDIIDCVVQNKNDYTGAV